MNRLAYYIYCLKKMNYKQLFKTIRSISEKNGHSCSYIFCDMVMCGVKYGAGYTDYQLYEFYNRSKAQREDCMTREKNNRIMRAYNQKEYTVFFDDKGLFYKNFNKYLKRDWIDIRGASLEELRKFLSKHDSAILKPAVGSGGKGVEKITIDSSAEAIYKKMKHDHQDLIEEVLIQHPALSEIYPTAINSLRLYTFFDGKQGHVLQRVIKFGNNGSPVDNFSSGGMYTFVDTSGTILYPCVDENDRILHQHPLTKHDFCGFTIPFYKEAEDLIIEASAIIPQVGYIGWDVAITASGPAIIEGNHYPGTFEPKGRFLSSGQTGSLPAYRNVMSIKL